MIARLSAVGYKNKEIATALDMSEGRISVILSDPRAQIDIADAVESVADNIIDLHDRLKAHAYEALDEIVDSMRHSKDEKVRQKSAFGILDRAGYTPVQKHVQVAPELPADVAARFEKVMAEMQDDTYDAQYEYIPPDEVPEDEADVEVDESD